MKEFSLGSSSQKNVNRHPGGDEPASGEEEQQQQQQHLATLDGPLLKVKLLVGYSIMRLVCCCSTATTRR